MGVACGYLIVLVFIYGTDDDNKLGSWRKKNLKKIEVSRMKRLNMKLFS